MTRFRILTTMVVGTALTMALTANTAQAAVPKARPAPTATKSRVQPNSVPPPTNYSYYWTEAAGESHVYGRYVGPSAATYYGRATIKGFTTVNGKRKATLGLTQYPSPLIGAAFPGTIGIPNTGYGRPPTMSPDSWYQPWTWNWPKIIGTSWDYVWNGCLKGSLIGSMGAIGTQAAVGLLVRGASMFLGPEAVVAVAIGSCWADMTSGP